MASVHVHVVVAKNLYAVRAGKLTM